MQQTNISVRTTHGFTLLELLVTVAVVAVIASFAVPNLQDFVRNSRLTGSSNELLRTIHTARTEAMRRQRNVIMCTSADAANDAAACSLVNVNGWIVFEDSNGNWDRDATEPLVLGRTFENARLTYRMDGSMRLSFAPTGFARPAGTTPATQTPSRSVVICDSQDGSKARGLFITDTGRARVTRNKGDIDTLLGPSRINATCP